MSRGAVRLVTLTVVDVVERRRGIALREEGRDLPARHSSLSR
jgi:hypothetical protein